MRRRFLEMPSEWKENDNVESGFQKGPDDEDGLQRESF